MLRIGQRSFLNPYEDSYRFEQSLQIQSTLRIADAEHLGSDLYSNDSVLVQRYSTPMIVGILSSSHASKEKTVDVNTATEYSFTATTTLFLQKMSKGSGL